MLQVYILPSQNKGLPSARACVSNQIETRDLWMFFDSCQFKNPPNCRDIGRQQRQRIGFGVRLDGPDDVPGKAAKRFFI